MHANAYDAHRYAGHRLRAGWHLAKARRLRFRLDARGIRALQQGNWARAYACFDWITVGWRDFEVVTEALSAVALQQMEREDEATEIWQKAEQERPGATHTARQLCAERGIQLPRGFPD